MLLNSRNIVEETFASFLSILRNPTWKGRKRENSHKKNQKLIETVSWLLCYTGHNISLVTYQKYGQKFDVEAGGEGNGVRD